MNTIARTSEETLNQISKDTLKSRVYTELKRALMSGSFEPGEAIVVRVIAEHMDIGTMPVRESVQQLITEGGLEILPNRTVRVPVLNAADLSEIFQIRVLLEGMATELATTRLTKRKFEEIEQLLPRAMQSNATKSPADAQLADLRFHFGIYEAAEAPHLMNIIENLWLKVGPLHIAPYKSAAGEGQSFFQTADLHLQLLEAFRGRKAKQARSLITRIIEHSLKWHLTFSLHANQSGT